MELQLIKRMSRGLYILLTVLLLLIPVSAKAQSMASEGMLYLSGVLVDINYDAKRVVVDIKTPKCKGRHTFYLDDMSKFPGREGKKIDFYLENAVCPNIDGSRMLWPRRIR